MPNREQLPHIPDVPTTPERVLAEKSKEAKEAKEAEPLTAEQIKERVGELFEISGSRAEAGKHAREAWGRTY